MARGRFSRWVPVSRLPLKNPSTLVQLTAAVGGTGAWRMTVTLSQSRLDDLSAFECPRDDIAPAEPQPQTCVEASPRVGERQHAPWVEAEHGCQDRRVAQEALF